MASALPRQLYLVCLAGLLVVAGFYYHTTRAELLSAFDASTHISEQATAHSLAAYLPSPAVTLPYVANSKPFTSLGMESTPSTLPHGTASIELVVAKMAAEDTSWIANDLADLIQPNGPLHTSIYVVNDPQAPLRTPANKGHEAMVYFTYIIDNYHSLHDITLFMHSHSGTWHNNDLLNASSAAMVRHLKPERVLRLGYMNMRCHWDPGCPSWMHPGVAEYDIAKQEQHIIARAWKELFPAEPVPATLAAPCCAQFATSRDRIRQHPISTYERMRDWLLHTDISDHDSGRVFEYFWQYIFNRSLTLCPHPRICYCEGYGVCFESEASYAQYFEVQGRYQALWDDVRAWREQRDKFEDFLKSEGDGHASEIENVQPPEPGLEEKLLIRIGEVDGEMNKLKQAALDLGSDPALRAALVEKTWDQIGPEADWSSSPADVSEAPQL